ncbi:hypothetical protein CEXT_75331, partial [Caerostris extrusa]
MAGAQSGVRCAAEAHRGATAHDRGQQVPQVGR